MNIYKQIFTSSADLVTKCTKLTFQAILYFQTLWPFGFFIKLFPLVAVNLVGGDGAEINWDNSTFPTNVFDIVTLSKAFDNWRWHYLVALGNCKWLRIRRFQVWVLAGSISAFLMMLCVNIWAFIEAHQSAVYSIDFQLTSANML